MDEIDENDFKYRVVTSLKLQERVRLEELAWESGRSMSGYIRYLVNEDIERNSD
jgi:predicted DNA-binding protein